jgi:hypothetical protein
MNALLIIVFLYQAEINQMKLIGFVILVDLVLGQDVVWLDVTMYVA